MSNLVTKVGEYGVRKTILIGQDSYSITLPCIVKGTANTVVKAGEPLVGDIEKRNAGFTAGTSGAVGLNLHDVKLDADGNGNGTIVLAGCVDLLKLDATVKAHVKTAAVANIIAVEGSAI